jgi:peptidase M28-like protein
MKLATYRLMPDASGAPLDLPPGASWARFGDEVLLYSDEARWDALAERAEWGALQLRERQPDVERELLHVVVQNGRLFQQENPDARVLVDRGRFLLVELDPDRARQLEAKGETCYGVVPLKENEVVFDVRDRTAERAAPVAWIQDLVDKVTSSNVETDLAHLVSFPTRYSTSSHYADAAAWARDQLEAMGYVSRLEEIVVDGSPSWNVIADKEGHAADARGIVLVTAHLDSINIRGGPEAPAPGADDNGSGSVGVLEIARALRDNRGEHDLRFMLFGGEEEGLFGSKQYVANLSAAERARIRAVVNMDMVGTLNVPTRSVLLEGAPLSQRVIDGLSEAAMTYTGLVVETSLHPFASDHVPFIAAEIPAVLTIEGADNTNGNVHSGSDTLDNINYDFTLEILRMNVAFIASEVNQAS